MSGFQRVCLILAAIALLGSCKSPPPPEGIFVASPRGYLRTGWMRPLVHSEIEPFYARQLVSDISNRDEFVNLMQIVSQGLQPLRRVGVGALTVGDYLTAARTQIIPESRWAEPEGYVVYHLRRNLEGSLEAEGFTLTLGKEVDRSDEGTYFFTLHIRLEDLIRDGAVDGRLDVIQVVIDTNSPTLGALEIVMTTRQTDAADPVYDFAISRLYDSSTVSREGTVTYAGEDNPQVVDWFQTYLWEPFRGEQFAALLEADPEGYLLPGEVIRLGRLEWDIPEDTNFPPAEASE